MDYDTWKCTPPEEYDEDYYSSRDYRDELAAWSVAESMAADTIDDAIAWGCENALEGVTYDDLVLGWSRVSDDDIPEWLEVIDAAITAAYRRFLEYEAFHREAFHALEGPFV